MARRRLRDRCLHRACYPAHITAIEPAEDQIAYAHNRPMEMRAAFRVGDAQSLPFADHEFDVAAMALVINFVPDAPKAGAPRSLLQVGSSTSRARPTASGRRRAARSFRAEVRRFSHLINTEQVFGTHDIRIRVFATHRWSARKR